MVHKPILKLINKSIFHGLVENISRDFEHVLLKNRCSFNLYSCLSHKDDSR